MKKHEYESDYGTVTATYMFDADNGDGIDIKVEGSWVGEIWDTFPDMDDPEEVQKFEDGIDEWLSRNF